MSRFAYTAVQNSGQRVAGTVRSRDAAEAVRRLLEMGYHPIDVRPAPNTGGVAGGLIGAGRRVRTRDLAVLTRQLASLLKAGLPVVQALQTLRKQTERPRLAMVLQDLEESLSRDGGTLSDAMDNHPRVFDPVYRGLVRSGEESGTIVEVLRGLADQLASSAQLRGQVVGAFIYPAFLLLLGTAAVFALTAFVIPQFESLFKSFNRQLPLPTRVLIAVSSFMAAWWWAVILAAGAVAVGTVMALRRQGAREAFDAALLRTPLFGPVVLRLEVARVSRTLASLLGSGIRLVEALQITGDTVKNLAIRRTFPPIIRGVVSGEPLSAGLEKAEVFPPVVVNLVRTGEETGELPDMLGEVAQIYRDEAERAVTGAVRLLEPILILIMGGIIAGIVAAIILPIFRTNLMVE